MAKKKSLKRDVVEWAVFIGIITILYVTGLHTPVLGALQGLVLKTGIMQPSLDEKDYGDASYDFSLKDAEGNVVSFQNFKGKTVFFNMWATWCPPCIAEMPDINELYEEIKDNKNVAFVMLSLDRDFEKARNFVNKKEFTLPIYQLYTNLPENYNSNSIPTTYVIDPQGKIVVTNKGMAKYNTKKFKKFLTGLNKDS